MLPEGYEESKAKEAAEGLEETSGSVFGTEQPASVARTRALRAQLQSVERKPFPFQSDVVTISPSSGTVRHTSRAGARALTARVWSAFVPGSMDHVVLL